MVTSVCTHYAVYCPSIVWHMVERKHKEKIGKAKNEKTEREEERHLKFSQRTR